MADMYRVTTLLNGPAIAGGGIQQFYFDVGGGTAAQAATAAKTFWQSLAGVVQAGHTAEIQAGVEQVVDTDGRVIALLPSTAATTAFTGGFEVLAPQTQGLVQWRSGAFADGREIRGRTFLPAQGESLNTLGKPAESLLTLVNASAAALISDANSVLVIWRRPRVARPQVGTPGDPWFLRAQASRVGEFAPAATGTMWSKWATLRSRRD